MPEAEVTFSTLNSLITKVLKFKEPSSITKLKHLMTDLMKTRSTLSPEVASRLPTKSLLLSLTIFASLLIRTQPLKRLMKMLQSVLKVSVSLLLTNLAI